MYFKKTTYQVSSISIPTTGFRFSALRVVSTMVGESIAAFILFQNNKDFII
ncbi:MAG TPA: hypothetical protein VL125_15475 [Pelobium sp.]|nr:hypothetical protein [Pelobium sp.]